MTVGWPKAVWEGCRGGCFEAFVGDGSFSTYFYKNSCKFSNRRDFVSGVNSEISKLIIFKLAVFYSSQLLLCRGINCDEIIEITSQLELFSPPMKSSPPVPTP